MLTFIEIEDAILATLNAAKVPGGALADVKKIGAQDEIADDARESELGIRLATVPALYVAWGGFYREGGVQYMHYLVGCYARNLRGTLDARKGTGGALVIFNAVDGVLNNNDCGINIGGLRCVGADPVSMGKGSQTFAVIATYETNQVVE